MFALTAEDLAGRSVDCAAAPASFNTEHSTEGHDV
jgi:hypothetical protein